MGESWDELLEFDGDRRTDVNIPVPSFRLTSTDCAMEIDRHGSQGRD